MLTHSNTGTPGTVTCLPVAAVECFEIEALAQEWAVWIKELYLRLEKRSRVFFPGYAFGYGPKPLAPPNERQ